MYWHYHALLVTMTEVNTIDDGAIRSGPTNGHTSICVQQEMPTADITVTSRVLLILERLREWANAEQLTI